MTVLVPDTFRAGLNVDEVFGLPGVRTPVDGPDALDPVELIDSVEFDLDIAALANIFLTFAGRPCLI